MIPPSSTSENVRSLVLLNFTVLVHVLHGNNILRYYRIHIHTGMIEPGKYSFYVGKRPQIAHCQLQQYYNTAAIAGLRFAVLAGTKFSACGAAARV